MIRMSAETRTTRPKRTTFDVATPGQGRAERTGYILGEYAAHKEAGKGVYCWTFTHLKTGASINVYPPHDKKDAALAHLDALRRDGLAEWQEKLLADGAWGLGL